MSVCSHLLTLPSSHLQTVKVQQTRHPVFQQIAAALSHQQEHVPELAVAYWENILNILPDDCRIHNDILAECERIARAAEIHRLEKKVGKLRETYHVNFRSDEEAQT